MTEPLLFRRAAEQRNTSWSRADPSNALIERWGGNLDIFVVWLQDGSQSHTVTYELDHGARVGKCTCKGWEYRDEPGQPCAHLCTLRKAEFIGAETVTGAPIRPYEPEPEPVTDGGRPTCAAGQDGEVFGRPDQQL